MIVTHSCQSVVERMGKKSVMLLSILLFYHIKVEGLERLKCSQFAFEENIFALCLYFRDSDAIHWIGICANTDLIKWIVYWP